MFKNILLVYSEKLSKKHLEALERIKSTIEKNHICKTARDSDLQQNCFDNIDLVITAGGDGTFIRASHFIKDIPILGINSEPETSEGALTSINEDQLEILDEILNGKYKKIMRQRAKIKRNSILLDNLALNEVYIGSLNQFHTSRYTIKFKGEEEQRSSGILVSTGSGSTAWFKSAGGKLFSPEAKELNFLVREPYFGRIFKPKILKGIIKNNEKIIIESKRYNGGIIAIDSDLTFDFNFSDKVEISLAENPLNILTREK